MIWRGSVFLRSALTLAALAALVVSSLGGEVPRMDKDELKAKLGNEDLIVIDTRRQSDWESSDGRIAGSVWEDPRGVQSWAAKYPKDKTIVLYCS